MWRDGIINRPFGVAGLVLALLFSMHHSTAVAQERDWKIEVIEDGGASRDIGRSTSLAIDPNGDLNVSYFDGSRNVLRYAFRERNASRWFITDVDRGGAYSSLAVDASGKPHFAYTAPNEAGLRYARWDGSKWYRQTIDPERIEFFNQIRIGPDGYPKISYYHRLHPDGSYALHPKYAAFDGKAWYTETVDMRSECGKMNSMVLDSQGRPHIAYTDFPGQALRYAFKNGDQWTRGTPDAMSISKALVGWANSIALDPSGSPAVAYMEVNTRKLKYAYRINSTWAREDVDTLVGRNDHVDRMSLAFDSQGHPHIAYYDGGLGALKYASKNEQGWHVVVVDSDGNPGRYASLAFAPGDVPFIAYYAADAHQARVAFPASASPTNIKSEKVLSKQPVGEPKGKRHKLNGGNQQN